MLDVLRHSRPTLYDYVVVPNYLATAVVDIVCKLILLVAPFLLNTRMLMWVYTIYAIFDIDETRVEIKSSFLPVMKIRD